jgi:hypothetical protein
MCLMDLKVKEDIGSSIFTLFILRGCHCKVIN